MHASALHLCRQDPVELRHLLKLLTLVSEVPGDLALQFAPPPPRRKRAAQKQQQQDGALDRPKEWLATWEVAMVAEARAANMAVEATAVSMAAGAATGGPCGVGKGGGDGEGDGGGEGGGGDGGGMGVAKNAGVRGRQCRCCAHVR